MDQLAMMVGRCGRITKQNSTLLIFLLVNGAITWLVPLYYGDGSDQFADFRHVTIEELLAKKNYTMLNLEKAPKREATPSERYSFSYLKADCPKNQSVNIGGGNFEICVADASKDKDYYKVKRAVYFVGGKRDELFEEGFQNATKGIFKLRVFPKKNGAQTKNRHSTPPLNGSTERASVAHSVEYFDIGPLTDSRSGQHGLKDIIDERDDTRHVEQIKLDVGNRTELLLFSINTGLEFCQVLLRHRFKDFNELRYLIARMNFAIFYPYAIRQFEELMEDEERGDGSLVRAQVHYLSFMKRPCMKRYGMGPDPHQAIHRRDEFRVRTDKKKD